jgi:AbrB family transcriptional regulator (stage V sporulation protein T)
MKATGVIRRIDELGRIVIPKEIRKNMTIKQGENLEIYTIDNDTIALKKYSTLSKFSEIGNVLIDTLYQTINKEVLLIDTSNIINCRGKGKDQFIDKYISEEMSLLLNDRKKIVESKKKDITITDSVINTSYIIEPIITNGDLIGGIIALSDTSFNKDEIALVDYTVKILNNYIEQ